MGITLHLRGQKLPISISDSKNHRLLALGHGPSDPARTFNCLDYIANSDIFNGLVGAISHQNRSTPANALHVMSPPLVLHPVAGLLDAAKLQHSPFWQSPNARLAVVAIARSKNLRHAFLNTNELHGLAAKNDAVFLRGDGEPEKNLGLPATSSAAIENNVRVAVVRRALRPRLRLP